MADRWEREARRRWFSTPYTLAESARWIANNLFGPSRRHAGLTAFMPRQAVVNRIAPRLTLGFVGDVMPINRTRLVIGPDLRHFVEDVDFLIGNFEGTISAARKVFMAQAHSPAILSFLEDLLPAERLVLCCANNHAGDFGWSEFNRSYERLKDRGIRTVGRRDEPAVVLGGHVNVANATAWSNQPGAYVARLEGIADTWRPEADFNVLCAHWGYEMQLYPHPAQVEFSQALGKRWGMIAGHHSHSPQPIVRWPRGRDETVVAYSLGNFCFGIRLFKNYHHGLVLKAVLRPGEDGVWRIGRVDWSFIGLVFRDNGCAEVELSPTCPFFERDPSVGTGRPPA